MKKQKRLGILLFLAVFLCSACLTGIVPTRVEALARYGIKGNGTGGITIDINASPYTDFANSVSRWTVGQKLQQLPTASRDGYTFLGWYTLASGGRQVDTGTVFTSDTTVFA